jgi:hypothetical protein
MVQTKICVLDVGLISSGYICGIFLSSPKDPNFDFSHKASLSIIGVIAIVLELKFDEVSAGDTPWALYPHIDQTRLKVSDVYWSSYAKANDFLHTKS